ncbi:nucleotidyltransferase family protein [Thalassobellus suaedae]|uniref:Nucleotidyltransferase family protein n=1 Tax=Thalassobellus suaedae TaxID=3074124 RepID=A0ABY9Y3V9_9FLAO|nr:nucleotidyltransferase family protein [Flavobacteriaceae bacterium HL-DH10]
MSKIPIIILAAGASSRMGSAKQLLNWGGKTLIEHTLQTALNTVSNDVIVVLGANYELIKKKITALSITILHNQEWEQGLGKSIASGVNYIMEFNPHADGVLIILADQPLIDSAYLNELIQVFNPSKNQIIATSYKNDTYGVPALFDKGYFKELSKLKNDKGAKHLLTQNESFVKTLVLPIKNVDLDSKEDYDMLYQANFKK